MKHRLIYELFIILLFFMLISCQKKKETHPRVFVFTDINIDSGDPDDRQSLIHLLWYANELDIEGIVPDRWNARGMEACQLAVDAYEKDFVGFQFDKKGYPEPSKIKDKLAKDVNDAVERFQKAASNEKSPLYVLIWGNMVNFGNVLRSNPALSKNIRLITIGTGLMMEEYRQHIPADWDKMEKPCEQPNWNGQGRNEIFSDSRFDKMWWLEVNWTYEGMFTGNEPSEMFHKLSEFGNLGKHMNEVVKNEPWAQYFRVGDTPSVLYIIDPEHNLNDPTKSSWAGKFIQPFPKKKPNYYADFNGPVEWNYANPCETWHNHAAFRDYAKSTLEDSRAEMYTLLLDKLKNLYSK